MASTPYNVDTEASALVATGLRPNILTGVVLWLLQRHFSAAATISDPALKQYIWDADPRTSKILIAPVWRWITQNLQQRPGIVIKRNALEPQQIAIGDGDAAISPAGPDHVPAEGLSVLQVAMVGSHTVFVLSEQPAEAEALATEVYVRLLQYQQAIAKEFLFNKFRVAEIGPVSKLEEASERFAVPITLSYTYMDAWSVWTEAPLLKRLIVTPQTL